MHPPSLKWNSQKVGRFATLSPPLPTPRFSAKSQIGLPLISAIAGYVGGFACVLNFGHVPPAIGLAAIEICKPVDLGQLSAGQRLPVPARHVGILCERSDGPTDERWGLGDGEVRRARCCLAPVRFADAIILEHHLRTQPSRCQRQRSGAMRTKLIGLYQG